MRMSVAMATYNGAAHLEGQLASIFDQSLRIDEVVISDDASTDSSLELVEAVFSERRRSTGSVPDLVLLRNENRQGVVANFERAMGCASGDLIFLCDQDDVWRSDRVEWVAGMFDIDPRILMINSDARLVDEQGSPLKSTLFEGLRLSPSERRGLESGNAFGALLRRNLVTGATSVVSRELLKTSLPTPSGWLHDEWLGVVAAVQGGLRTVPEALIDYRQHDSNVIGVELTGVRGDLRRLVTPRVLRNQRLLVRAEQLELRAHALCPRPVSADLQLIAEKVSHEKTRSGLPRSRWRRVKPVLTEAMNRGYARFGGGSRDVLRDLVQPAAMRPAD